MKTTNMAEGYNRHWKEVIEKNKSYANIYKCFEVIQMENESQIVKVDEAMAGEWVNPLRRPFKLRMERQQKLVQPYINGEYADIDAKVKFIHLVAAKAFTLDFTDAGEYEDQN